MIGSQAEQAALERRMTISARQHKADLSDAQLQVQVRLHALLSATCPIDVHRRHAGCADSVSDMTCFSLSRHSDNMSQHLQ